jgi:hypothetical protein
LTIYVSVSSALAFASVMISTATHCAGVDPAEQFLFQPQDREPHPPPLIVEPLLQTRWGHARKDVTCSAVLSFWIVSVQ